MSKFKWLIFFALAILLFVLFNGALSHILYWHEQHQLFLFSDIYFSNLISQQAGLLKYITAFCVQFFYLPTLGSIILSISLSFVFLLNTLIIEKITTKYDKLLWSLLPALYLVVQCCSINYPPSIVIGVVINQLLFLIFLFVPSSLRLVKQAILYIFLIVLFFATGIHSILFLGFSVIYVLKNRNKFYMQLLPVVLFIGLLFLTSYYYRVPLSAVLNTGERVSNNQNVILFILFFLPFVSSFFISKYLPEKKMPKLILALFCIVVYISLTFWGLFENHSYRTRLMLNVDKCVKAQQWDKVLELTPKYYGKNQLVCYLNNLALYYTGRMSDELFRYPQDFGVNSLYFVWSEKDAYLAEEGGLLLAGLGFYNEANRWAFESMVVFGETAPILKKLINYNIAIGRPQVAQHFINTLKKSLFYSRDAINFEKQLTLPELRKLSVVHDSTVQSRFANFTDLTGDLLFLCNKEPKNRMAFEYLMANYLLSNRVIDFANNLWRMKELSYNRTPISYEEALLIFELMYPEDFKELNISISDNTRNRFDQYKKLYAATNIQEIERLYSNTYWYYIHFKSPYGNKILAE